MLDGFASIGDIINKEPALRRIKNLIRAGDVVVDFCKIFPDLESSVKPVKTEKRVLYLSVENSVLRNELKFRENLIVEKVNRYFSEEIIKSIRFTSK